MRRHKPRPEFRGRCRDCGEGTWYTCADDGPAYQYWRMVLGDITSARPVLVCPECMAIARAEMDRKYGPLPKEG
jgi:hypothetical protein